MGGATFIAAVTYIIGVLGAQSETVSSWLSSNDCQTSKEKVDSMQAFVLGLWAGATIGFFTGAIVLFGKHK
jgi:hypothetical protein